MPGGQPGDQGCALVAFAGTTVDDRIAALVSDPRVAGVTLYGALNIADAEQTIRLTADLQAAAGRQLLIAVDQEGGQLLGAGPHTTPFAGNMALGAVGDADLVGAVGEATGRELAALGINVNYAPVADVASRPYNPSLGIRSFGEDPDSVSRLTAAMVTGLQSAGVAATLKHFPGKGEAQVDPHLELPVLDLDLERLQRVEFAPFRAGIGAGAQLVMIGHYGLPAVTGDRNLPSSASPAVLKGLLRGQLGFDGIIVTDALDMGGFAGVPLEGPLDAGADLLLYGPAQAGALPDSGRPAQRLGHLLSWILGFERPDPSVIGCAAHRRLAADLARRSITLVRDDAHILPLRLTPTTRVLAVMPRPTDLTPADTSSTVAPGLAPALRSRHRPTTGMVVGYSPTNSEIAGVVTAAADHDLVVIGTIDTNEAQTTMVQSILATGRPTVVVALRTPYDLASYPQAPTYLASYGIHPPTLEALTDCLLGTAPIGGRLPVAIPGLYPVGHGIRRGAQR